MLEKINSSFIGRFCQKTITSYLIFFAFLSFNIASAQEVPHSILLGGLEIKIEPSAQIQIELEINKLNTNWSSTTFKEKVSLYLPFISKIFKEEGIPDFLIYAILQKNNLDNSVLGDSNRGLWELDEAFTQEWGLLVNEQVDERLHLSQSSLAVTKLLKRNNLFFKNWIFSLWSLEEGFEYVKAQSKSYELEEINKNQKMVLTNTTPDFILQFLACKILYESHFESELNYNDKLFDYQKGANKKFSQIAKEFSVDEEVIELHNPWLKTKKIPSDKVYSVLIPLPSFDIHWQEVPNQEVPEVISPQKNQIVKKKSSYHLEPPIYVETPVQPPTPNTFNKSTSDYFHEIVIIDHNNSTELEGTDDNISNVDDEANQEEYPKDIKIHTVVSGQTLFSIAPLYGIALSDLRRWNGLLNTDDIFPGDKLIVSPINQPANIIEHYVQAGETLYKIAEAYDVKIEEIQNWNNKGASYDIDTGEILTIIPSSKVYLSPLSDDRNFYQKYKKEMPLIKD